MKPELIHQLSFRECVHRNQKVILCSLPYNPGLLKEFRSEFPSAKWSRMHNAWYVKDSTLYRSQLKLPLPEIGDAWLAKLYEHNKTEFVKFRNALSQKAFSPNTINTYLSEFAQLLVLLKQHPVDAMTAEQLNSYFLYCIKKLKHSEAQVHSRMNAIKSYFRLVLHKETVFDHVIRPQPHKQLPKVLSKQEIAKLFTATKNVKHLLILKTAYGMGLRVSELVALKVHDVDMDKRQVHIVSPKGKKDRYVHFPESLKPLYLDYLKAYQPLVYLFEGRFSEQYTVRSAQSVFRNAMKKAGISKSSGIHGLRHSYATLLLEAGTDMGFIQKLRGRNHTRTTGV